MTNQMLSYLGTWCRLCWLGVTNPPSNEQIATWIAVVASNLQPSDLPDCVIWTDQGSQDAFWDWLLRFVDDAAYLDSRREVDI